MPHGDGEPSTYRQPKIPSPMLSSTPSPSRNGAPKARQSVEGHEKVNFDASEGKASRFAVGQSSIQQSSQRKSASEKPRTSRK